MNGFAKHSEEILQALDADTYGRLTNHEVQGRLNQYGDNSSRESKPSCSLFLFLCQFENPLLIVAGVSVIYRQRSRSFEMNLALFDMNLANKDQTWC